MSYEIKQSQTALPLVFLLVDAADHITGKTGLTPTVTIRKVGGAFGAPAGAVTEIANGFYQVAGNATDADTLGPLLLHATGTGADPVDVIYPVVANTAADVIAALPSAGTIADAVWDEALVELSAGAPSATPAMRAAIALLYMALRNKKTETSAASTIHNDAGTAVAAATLSDDGTTFTKSKYGAP